MKNWRQIKPYIFWKILPFILTGCFLLPVVLYETEDPTYWFIFLPAVVLCLFPFSIAVSYRFRMSVKARKLIIPRELIYQNPQLEELSGKAGKWEHIAILTWICVFLFIAVIAINFIRIERREPGWELVKHDQPKTLSEGSQTHALLCTLDTTVQFLWPIPLIALAFGAVILFRLLLQRKRGRRKTTGNFWKIAPFTAVACFVIPILLIFALGSIMQKVVREEVKDFLNNVSSKATVKINKQLVKNQDQVIAEISKVAPLPAHHSHATKRFRIEIRDSNEGLVIELGRDSSRDQEYWVFYLGYGHTYVNEIGRITTSLFDD